jgi:dimethylamine/trimethylamine dehydrogenase
MPNVNLYPASRLTADDVLEFGCEAVFLATGSRWRRDGLGRQYRQPLAASPLPGVYSPDEVLAGATPQGPVVVYDDDHYVMAGALAERLARQGFAVRYLTPASKVSEWTDMTMEQPRIQACLLELGVQIETGVALDALAHDGSALSFQLRCVYTGRLTPSSAGSLVLVTMRDPDDALYQALLQRRAEWAAAGIEQVQVVGDALAPGTVAAAVHAGHLAAREFDAPESDLDAVPFLREARSTA